MVVCSAPGKILWIGGYAVLERPNVSFITGVDKRVYAEAEEAAELRFVSKQFGFDFTTVFDGEKIACANEKANFVCFAAEVCLRYLKAKGMQTKNFVLTTFSDPAFGVEDKAGLGSSAAVTVASVAAIMALHGFDVEGEHRSLVHKLSQFGHSEAQGGKIGSGFDIAASTFGASKYVRYSPSCIDKTRFPDFLDEDWDCVLEKVKLPADFRVAIANIAGESMSTSEAVKKWKVWKEQDQDENSRLFEELNDHDVKAIEALLAKDYASFQKHFQEGWDLTALFGEKIGAPVSTPGFNALVEKSLQNGAFVCKLPGAGGGDSIAAFCLSDADRARLESFWQSYSEKKLVPLGLSVSNEGVRIEERMPVQ